MLKPGDMLVYKGMILEHWREAFIGQDCAQVFLHYNNTKSKEKLECDKVLVSVGRKPYTEGLNCLLYTSPSPRDS